MTRVDLNRYDGCEVHAVHCRSREVQRIVPPLKEEAQPAVRTSGASHKGCVAHRSPDAVNLRMKSIMYIWPAGEHVRSEIVVRYPSEAVHALLNSVKGEVCIVELFLQPRRSTAGRTAMGLAYDLDVERVIDLFDFGRILQAYEEGRGCYVADKHYPCMQQSVNVQTVRLFTHIPKSGRVWRGIGS